MLMMKRISSCLLAVVMISAAADVPKTATIIPAPREMRVTGGEYWERKPPKLEKVAGIPPEGYELSITTNDITIRHSDDAGAFYAKITLEQLRADAMRRVFPGNGTATAGPIAIPCVEIKDAPAFRWRGVMLDEGRHFFGKETVKGLLDLMAEYKLNVFHWQDRKSVV